MNRRYFEFTQDKSNKFWEIDFSELSFTVRWGRCGTVGQSKEKTFETKEEALKKGEKQIQEKLKEGYVEINKSESEPVKAKKVKLESIPTQTSSVDISSDSTKPAEPVSSLKAEPLKASITTNISADKSLGLTSDELRWAPWREIPTITMEEPQPFDKEKALKKLKSIKFKYYGWHTDWSGVRVPMFMSKIEAHFWVEAMVNVKKSSIPENERIENLINHMKSFEPDGNLSFKDAVSLFTGKHNQLITEDIILPLYYLLGIEQLCELMTKPLGSDHRDKATEILEFADSFRQLVLPLLTPEQLECCHIFLRPKLARKAWPAVFHPIPIAFLLASPLGMHEELLEVIESWPDDLVSENYYTPRHQEVIFGLRDPALVNRHMRRLKLALYEPQYIKAWLAHTEYSELDYIVYSINRSANKGTCESLLKAFSCIKAPEAAAPMLELYHSSKAPRLAKEWIELNRQHAIEGFAAAAGGSGKLADAALDMLRTSYAQGCAETIIHAVEKLPEATREKIRSEVLENEALTAPLLDKEATPKKIAVLLPAHSLNVKLPLWLSIEELPPILVKKCRLDQKGIINLLLHLMAPVRDKTAQLINEFKKEGDAASLENFGWKLFELWLGVGAPSKEKWAFAAIGYTGGDRTALKLSPMIRVWPGESQHQRAVAGLDILRAIGTDTALMQLNGIAQKVPFKALKQRANECMEAIAKDKGLSKAELEDRIVPDCGLDEKGRYEFDFGPRKYTFALGQEMKPMVRDEQGALRGDLPKPNLKDDAGKAAVAVDTWKLMKKQIKEVAKIQAGRLEQAMIVGRQWTCEQFEMLLVRHPLMFHLSRLILWAGYSGSGTLIKTFRVTDEGDYSDETDSAVNIDDCERIGIIHPLNLTLDSAVAWGELFSDYEIIPPFPQLGRSVYTLDEAELKNDSIQRFTGMNFPAPTLVFTLEKFEWMRGTPMDAGCFDEHSKQFPAANVTVVLAYDGNVGMGYIDPEEDLSITSVYFVSGLREPSGYESKEVRLPLAKVDRVVISEVLHDLSSLAAKAK